jgi:hypothetical protein
MYINQHLWKIKSNHKNFVHLVGLYTYCEMMHGVYNVNFSKDLTFLCISKEIQFRQQKWGNTLYKKQQCTCSTYCLDGLVLRLISVDHSQKQKS